MNNIPKQVPLHILTVAVTVQGYGTFHIPQQEVSRVVSMLQSCQAVMTRNESPNNGQLFSGCQLLNESMRSRDSNITF